MAIPGLQELALLALIAISAFALRRVIQAQLSDQSPASSVGEARPRPGIRPMMRLAVVASLLFVAVAALLLRPWAGNPISFFTYGLLPLCAAWGVAWVIAGYSSRRG